MSNDVVMIVITKELQDKLLSYCPDHEAWKALRAAPETVSLEGVAQGSYKQWRILVSDDEWMCRVSDLRRLVSPVQPSAVVSRPDIWNAYHDAHRKFMQTSKLPVVIREGGAHEAEFDAVFALQLTQPVAPVQNGGVPTVSIDEADDILTEFQKCGCNNPAHLRDLINASLSTTQSAPLQPSAVVSREDRRKAFEEKAKYSGLDLEHCDYEGEDEYKSSSTERAYEVWCDAWDCALQLPQPVAPVQSGGVELIEELARYKEKAQHFADALVNEMEDNKKLISDLAHLTTTQSAIQSEQKK